MLEQRPMPSSGSQRPLENRLVKDRLYAERRAELAERPLAPFPPAAGDLAAARQWAPSAEHVGRGPRFAFACACGRGGCAERIELGLDEFAGLPRVVSSSC